MIDSSGPEAEDAPSMLARRRLVLAGVTGTAAAAGVGLSWWQRRSGKKGGGKETPGSDSADLADFWAQQFQSLQGQTLPMSAWRDKPLLLNFWATWCPPCVEEMPLLDQFFRQHAVQGWQVLGMAIDAQAKVEQFVRKTPVSFPVVLAQDAGIRWSRALGNLGGSLPFSVAFSSNSQPIYRKIGKLTQADLTDLAANTQAIR